MMLSRISSTVVLRLICIILFGGLACILFNMETLLWYSDDIKPHLTGYISGTGVSRGMIGVSSSVLESIQNANCPVSTKRRRYAQAHIDTALFEQFWSNPLKCYGTFVELGAADGQGGSNTKFFEDYLGWNGVLIEPFAKHFNKIKLHRKNTINHNVAICPEGQRYVEFIEQPFVGGIADHLEHKKIKKYQIDLKGNKMNVSCEPIGPLLRRSNITKIDLFSLDVEGAELIVLETMDWSISVHVFIIEMDGAEAEMEKIRQFLKNKGFVSIKSEWDIKTYDKIQVFNEVFVNPEYNG